MSNLPPLPGEPLGQDTDAVADNSRRLRDVISQESADWQAAIDTGDGSAIHHAAEIELLSEMGDRINYLIGVYGIYEPIDGEFIHEVIDFLKASDYDRTHSDISHSKRAEVRHLSTALQSLQARNGVLPEAA